MGLDPRLLDPAKERISPFVMIQGPGTGVKGRDDLLSPLGRRHSRLVSIKRLVGVSSSKAGILGDPRTQVPIRIFELVM